MLKFFKNLKVLKT